MLRVQATAHTKFRVEGSVERLGEATCEGLRRLRVLRRPREPRHVEQVRGQPYLHPHFPVEGALQWPEEEAQRGVGMMVSGSAGDCGLGGERGGCLGDKTPGTQ